MQILVIEDSDSIARMIQALVEGRGHTVRTVSAGVQSFDAALDQPPTPDVVLLDWAVRASLSSTEIYARLRRAERTREVPVMALGETDEDAKAHALELGVHAYYTKPFSPLALLKEIEGLPTRPSSRFKTRS